MKNYTFSGGQRGWKTVFGGYFREFRGVFVIVPTVQAGGGKRPKRPPVAFFCGFRRIRTSLWRGSIVRHLKKSRKILTSMA